MNDKYDQFLENLKNRAISLEENNHNNSAAYIASILGMWYHTLHQFPANPFENNSVNLYKWFQIGYDASVEGIKQDEKLQQLYKKYEEKQKNQKKSSFWTLKSKNFN